ncbi:MAG: hypothetical protein NMNS01_01100 [Nitrosomonas sp.]|nr:MAG: hypothetical protein NMNS01_01100 [Nitrosomonas sp.]
MAKKKSDDSAEKQAATTSADHVEPEKEKQLSELLVRSTVSQSMEDNEKRRKWGLPNVGTDKYGPYIVELNVIHTDGLPSAEIQFKALYEKIVSSVKKTDNKQQSTEERRPLLKIAKTYYRCDFKDKEWRQLVAEDEKKPLNERAIYRLWPDFPVKSQTMYSTATIKADAALRSFDASGDGIVWAVIDSGVDADHPHFGSTRIKAEHALYAPEVAGLHRCFSDRVKVQADGFPNKLAPLASPDWDSALSAKERKKLLDEHRRWALHDDFGHGTHVAGIIAGVAPSSADSKVYLLEHVHRIDAEGDKISANCATRTYKGSQLQRPPRGVAPRCKLVSLRVLDHKGEGRASQIIQALEYIREKINDNPKMMRVHGVNLSVGYEFDAEMFACGQSPLCTMVDRLVQEGVVVVTAAGNTGYGSVAASARSTQVGLSNTINDPGNAAQAITVGATHRDSPHTFGVSYFSSKGPTGDGRIKPDLVAPGERITSCAAGSKLADALKLIGKNVEEKSAYYLDDSGTSMAAPHVSGAVAAFLSIRREFIGRPTEVKRIFLESATPLGRERYFEGYGLVDLMRAIQLV